MPNSTQQLAWLGIDPEALRTLEPYIVILPDADGFDDNFIKSRRVQNRHRIDRRS